MSHPDQSTRQAAPNSEASSEPRPGHGDGFIVIPKLAADAETVGAFVRASLHAIRRHFAAPIASISVRYNAQTLSDEAIDEQHHPDTWRPAVQPLLLAAQTDSQAIARLYRDANTGELLAAAATPLPRSASELAGAVAVCAVAYSEADLPGILAELRGLAGLVCHLAAAIDTQGPTAGASSDAATDAVARGKDYSSATELAFAITNSLRSRFDCEQAAMGFVAGARVRLACVSGLDDLKPRSPGTVRIRQAMEECLDQRHDVLYQIEDGWDEAASVETRYRLHKQWHDNTGGAAVLSIPLMLDDDCLAVVSLRRKPNRPFTRAEVLKLSTLLAPFAPALVVVRRASRSVLKTAADRSTEAVSWLGSPRNLVKKAIYAALLAGALWFCFGTIDYNVATKAVIAAERAAHVVSPYEAPIATAFVTQGDRVEAGDALVAFDTTEFELHRDQLLAERRVLETELEQALAADELKDVALTDARLGVVEARLAQVAARLERAVLRSPIAGTVVQGQLNKRIGQVVPQGAPLFEIAPHGAWRVELDVPEASIQHVTAGQSASFTWSARPEQHTPLTISRISPTAEPRDRRNVFPVHAALDGDAPDFFRLGMEGHAEVHAGRKPVWWVVLHRAINAARMELWL